MVEELQRFRESSCQPSASASTPADDAAARGWSDKPDRSSRLLTDDGDSIKPEAEAEDGFLLGFVNALNNQTFAREQSAAGCNMGTAPYGNVSDLRAAWGRFGLRGFIGLEWGHNIWKQKQGEAYGQRWDGVERSALEPDWEQNLHELIESAAPEIKEVSSSPFRSLPRHRH